MSFKALLITVTVLATASTILISPAQAQPFAYVTNQASEDRVWVIDTATNNVVDTVALEDIPARVAITPDGAFAYVTIVVNEDFSLQDGSILMNSVLFNSIFVSSALSDSILAGSFFSNKVAVIDTSTNELAATVTTPTQAPFGIAITPDGAFAYVAHLSTNVSVISTATNTVVATIQAGGEATDVAITPDGAFVYVTNTNSDSVAVISTATNNVVTTVPVADVPSGIAITPDGAFVYVANLGSDNVSVISTLTNTVIATLPVGRTPGSIAITPDGAFAYVTHQWSNDVYVIDTMSNNVVTTLLVGDTPIDIAIKPDGSSAYVTNFFSDDVSVIDVATNTLADTVPVGFLPEGIAITPEPFVIDVTMNIKPGDDPNEINPSGKQKIPVAVLTTDSFDATQVAWETVSFGPGGATEFHERAHVKDVDSDGDMDMVLHFDTQDTGIQCGDTDATLKGETSDGQAIEGTDTIVTVNCD